MLLAGWLRGAVRGLNRPAQRAGALCGPPRPSRPETPRALLPLQFLKHYFSLRIPAPLITTLSAAARWGLFARRRGGARLSARAVYFGNRGFGGRVVAGAGTGAEAAETKTAKAEDLRRCCREAAGGSSSAPNGAGRNPARRQQRRGEGVIRVPWRASRDNLRWPRGQTESLAPTN